MKAQNANRDYLDKLVGIFFLIVLSVCFVLNIGKPISLFIGFANKTATEETIGNFETDLAQGFAHKYLFVDMNGLAHKVLLQRTMNDWTMGMGANCLTRLIFRKRGLGQMQIR